MAYRQLFQSIKQQNLLIKEIFQKEYPIGTNIKMLSTEYVVSKVYEHGEKRIEAVRSDLLIQMGSKDIYHMECQMKQGGDIAIRIKVSKVCNPVSG